MEVNERRVYLVIVRPDAAVAKVELYNTLAQKRAEAWDLHILLGGDKKNGPNPKMSREETLTFLRELYDNRLRECLSTEEKRATTRAKGIRSP